jgi:hypothetical protein
MRNALDKVAKEKYNGKNFWVFLQELKNLVDR